VIVVEVDAEFVSRVAALDVGKAEVVVCMRVPGDGLGARRRQEVRTFSTRTAGLLEVADWLRVEQVELVSMESTSSYWKPVFYLLEASGLRVWLLNARSVKNVPGRPKTDKLDAVWLAKVTERGMCAPSLVQPKPIRVLRDLTRYRRSVVRDRTREKQRMEKLLEDAGIKLSSVVSDLFGVTARVLIEAMIGGQRDARTLTRLAGNRLRTNPSVLREALTGYFEDHHAFLARQMLDRVDAADAAVARLDEQIQTALAPFRRAADQLDTIPGVGPVAAAELIAEIGTDMSRFPTAGHLASWAKFAPIEQSSAGRSRAARTGKGDPWLAATLGEIVAVAGRGHTFLGDRYRRLARRRGARRAIVAVGNSVLVIIWNLLSNPDQVFVDLGEGFHTTRHSPAARQRDLIRQLERITGQAVTLKPRAA
jgi:transposase